jgi:type IV pilus assembly protein PilV
MNISSKSLNKGFSMIEVMVTLLIILVGLLGIGGLQMQAQISELESYQRAQALIIMSDIVDRININRTTVNCFQITTNTTAGTPFIGAAGTGHLGTPACTASTAAYNTQTIAALVFLNNQLDGAGETLGGINVGAMIGARACISYDSTTEIGKNPGTGLLTVIVTWQGMAPLIAPVNMNCAVGLYGGAANRRAISTTVRIGSLI